MPATTEAWIAIGANLGPRGSALRRTREALAAEPGLSIAACSRELLTRAVGVTRQPDFHNQVLQVRSGRPLTPRRWLDACHRAEAAAGRRPTYRWGPRRADADILLLGAAGEIRAAGPELEVPHPRLAERPFFCALLAELSPGLVHPDGWAFSERGEAGSAG